MTRCLIATALGLAVFLASAALDGDWSDAPLWGLVLAEIVMLAVMWRALRSGRA
jgi:hypothetical protein